MAKPISIQQTVIQYTDSIYSLCADQEEALAHSIASTYVENRVRVEQLHERCIQSPQNDAVCDYIRLTNLHIIDGIKIFSLSEGAKKRAACDSRARKFILSNTDLSTESNF